jgi:hypothetical protein
MFNSLIRQPIDGKVYGSATSTTHGVFKTPDEWLTPGGKVVLEALTANMYVVFGSVITVEADAAAVSSVDGSTKVMTQAAKTAAYVPAGTAIEFILDATSTYFSIEGDATGAWRGWRSSF